MWHNDFHLLESLAALQTSQLFLFAAAEIVFDGDYIGSLGMYFGEWEQQIPLVSELTIPAQCLLLYSVESIEAFDISYTL